MIGRTNHDRSTRRSDGNFLSRELPLSPGEQPPLPSHLVTPRTHVSRHHRRHRARHPLIRLESSAIKFIGSYSASPGISKPGQNCLQNPSLPVAVMYVGVMYIV